MVGRLLLDLNESSKNEKDSFKTGSVFIIRDKVRVTGNTYVYIYRGVGVRTSPDYNDYLST